MVVFVTCKNEEDPIKSEGTRVLTRLYVTCSDAQWQLTPQSAVEFRRNSNLSKLLCAFVTCKNEMKKVQSKTKALEC